MPFLRAHAPDVACLQELVESDIDAIRLTTGLTHCHFVPMSRFSLQDDASFGVGILSRYAFEHADTLLYAGHGDGLTVVDRATPESRVSTMRYAIARVRLVWDSIDVTLATTHFPWTDGGQPSDFQYDAVDRLIRLLGDDPLVLCGDFNAPRGGPIFDRLARRWADSIPAGVSTSIDPNLHRAGALDLMVDGLFATRDFVVDDVHLHTGLSDHQGVTATVRRLDKPT